jgi:hypothetical protein
MPAGAAPLCRAFETSEIIVTSFVHPPIPMRQFDWSATRRSYEPGSLIGYGPTEQAAIDDLLAQEAEA